MKLERYCNANDMAKDPVRKVGFEHLAQIAAQLEFRERERAHAKDQLEFFE